MQASGLKALDQLVLLGMYSLCKSDFVIGALGISSMRKDTLCAKKYSEYPITFECLQVVLILSLKFIHAKQR